MFCILCGSENTEVRFEISSRDLQEKWKVTFSLNIQEEIGNTKTIRLMACNSCQILFFDPIYLSGSEQLYAKLQNFPWYYMPRKWEHDIAIKDIERNDRVLEIGCGRGDFLERLRAEEGVNNIEGIELNERAVVDARERGLPVKKIDMKDLVAESVIKYDVVCSFQVLEHVSNPKEFLEWSCALLKPGGKLIVGLPNADSFLKYQFNLLDMPPHHLTRWPMKTLSKLPNFLPLKLEYVKKEPLEEYHVDGYVKAYCDKLKSTVIARKFCHSSFRKVLIAILKETKLRKLFTGQSSYALYKHL